MAKKKKRKQELKEQPKFVIELFGLLLIFLSIVGICKFGILGNFLKSFAAFLIGEWYVFLFIISIFIGINMIVKREKVNFFSTKLVGVYLIIIAILTLIHLPYTTYKGFEIISETFENLCKFIENPNSSLIGGGMIGSIFLTIFTILLDKEGAKIISIFLMIGGAILFTGKSIYDILDVMKEYAKTNKSKLSEKAKIEISKAEDDYEEETNIVTVASMEELKHNSHPVSEHIEITTEQQLSINEETGEIEELDEDKKVEINRDYFLPSLNLLNRPVKNSNKDNEAQIEKNAPILETVLKDFGIQSKVVSAHVGPSVTQYELEIKAGTKVSRITTINREIALALAAKDVRIQAPIPGKGTIGIELPNKKNSMVTVREVLDKLPNKLNESKLAVTLGKDIMGSPQYCEINKTPHLLVAGSTGSGKSVCINSFIISILMRAKPDEVKLVLVDPKKVELSMYNGVPHLYAPVVTDPKKANIALKKMVVEMERRYDEFERTGTKNIAGYNTLVEKKNETLPDEEKMKKMPYFVIIIDELADLMLVAAKEVQDSIMRITQMARAAGMHLIVATQRPSTDVITGVIKANIPSRIAFAVSSGIDSRTILDQMGAEKLLGKGDMLFLPQGENTPVRIQGTFISDEEIKTVVDYTIKQQIAQYDMSLTMDDEELNATTMQDGDSHEFDGSDDPLYDQIVEFVVLNGKASTSSIQRRFRVGYNRAANLIDKLYERGVIGPPNGSKPRTVLIKLEQQEELE